MSLKVTYSFKPVVVFLQHTLLRIAGQCLTGPSTSCAFLRSASNMISDGSELLLLVPAVAGMVGSVVLPVLGAVPDGAIVLFSGMGDDAQDQLSVGVGALAGSTIMLLTVPW